MSVTIGDILTLLNGMAPPELAESYDNIGLLAGHPGKEVSKIFVSLDLTMDSVKQAEEVGAQLIVTHHPIFFRGRKNLREDDAEGAAVCRMVRAGIGLIAAHTNLDNANPGVNDALAEALGLTDVRVLEHGMRIGRASETISEEDIGRMTEEKLGGRARVYASGSVGTVERIAVCGGSAGGFWKEAAAAGAQAFITGEVSYHEALDAVAAGLCIVEAGHYETEQIAIKMLADGLQKRINELQYNVSVSVNARAPFRCVKG